MISIGQGSLGIKASSIATGTKTIATAGTAECLVSSSTPCILVLISADLGNTGGPIVVGDSSVIAADSSQRGVVVIPGNDPVPFAVDNVNLLYADVQTNGDKVCYTYFVK